MAMADTASAAMSRTHTRCAGANSRPDTCSRASCASTAAASPAPAASASEQRAGRRDQQCRYGGCCKKLNYCRHEMISSTLVPRQAGQRSRPDLVPSFVQVRAHVERTCGRIGSGWTSLRRVFPIWRVAKSKHQPMKFATTRPFADPEKAARKLLEIANATEVVQDGRIQGRFAPVIPREL